jgi:hypothetical protein
MKKLARELTFDFLVAYHLTLVIFLYGCVFVIGSAYRNCSGNTSTVKTRQNIFFNYSTQSSKKLLLADKEQQDARAVRYQL